MIADIIALLEAFRVILRAGYPDRPGLADEIGDLSWFHYWRRRGVPAAEYAAAAASLDLLRENIRSGKIHLRAVLNPTQPPINVDPIDAATGELRLFEGTLVFYAANSFRVEKRYTNVHCLKDDLAGVSRPSSLKPRKRAHQQELVLPVLKRLWPGGVPLQTELGNRPLCKQVLDLLGRSHSVSDDTILRAAGRIPRRK